jgi:hypothetical protein
MCVWGGGGAIVTFVLLQHVVLEQIHLSLEFTLGREKDLSKIANIIFNLK